MTGADPLHWDAPAIAAAVRARQADPVAVIDAFLDQIRRANPAVNALVNHDEAAPRAEAANVRRRVAAGEALPLAGVPTMDQVLTMATVGGARTTAFAEQLGTLEMGTAALKQLHDDLGRALSDDEVQRRHLSKALLPHVKWFYAGYMDPAQHQPFYRASSVA